ncbi:MAG: ABC transporter permease [Cyclobacteriaceae bacterium]|nr:ABC transporter permease [Cyclobacteriaceae bacterium]
MIKNLLTISIRNILKDRIYSLINLLGLTVGITCSLFLVFFVMDELSYDRFHENKEDVYRVVTQITEVDNQFTWAVAQIPFAPAVKKDYPEVTAYARLAGTGRMMFKKGETNVYEEDLMFADSSTFDLLTFPFIQGDPETALYDPFSVVINRDLAIKYFGRTDVVGESLVGENDSYKITGVIENLPKNTHLNEITGFISYNSQEARNLEGHWGNFGVFTYIHAPGLTDPAAFEEKLEQVYDNYCAEIFEQFGITFKYQLQNIQDIHLYSHTTGEAGVNGDIAYVYVFSAVAFIILLIASINYMNLATARSLRRAREVGIRKVMGSTRRQIIAQFLIESLLFTFLALLISIVLVLALLPFYNDLLDKGIGISFLLKKEIVFSLLGIVALVGILSGSYPAFFLSSFRPVTVLKSNSSSKTSNPLMRKILVIIQFGISVTMIISTWVVYDQLEYLRTKDLGFDKDQVVRITLFNEEMRERIPVLKEELKKLPSVSEVGTANTSPGYGIGKNLINVEDSEGAMVERGIDLYGIDYDYIPALGLRIVEGRNFSRDFPSDTAGAVLVTEAMAKRMNWDEAIGKKFQFGVGEDDPFVEVIGVVRDYHHRSLYDIIEPILFYLNESNNILHVKINGNDPSRSLAEVEGAWKQVFPNRPFEYNFLDQEFDEQYRNDQRQGKIFSIFSFLTIIIASLGLLGLAAYTTQQRTKEIGIRKVVGAGLHNIVFLISKDFLILILISIILAFPLAYFFIEDWLQHFAYRIEIDYMVFPLAAFLALAITFLTISYHTFKAAGTNPATSLREE